MSPDDPAECYIISIWENVNGAWVLLPKNDYWTELESHLLEFLWDELEENSRPREREYEKEYYR